MVDSGMQADVVRFRLSQLERLLDDVDRQFTPLRIVQERQGSAMWTDISACEKFAGFYTETLMRLEVALTAVRANVQVLLVNLAESARELTRTEDDIRERMVALAEQLNSMPVLPPDPVSTTSPAPTAPGVDIDSRLSGGYGGNMPADAGSAQA